MKKGHTMTVHADQIRMAGVSGDMWFCDNNDIDANGNHIPKLILAKDEYSSVTRQDIDDKDDTSDNDNVAWL